jgi:hypothetical protein
MYDKMSFGLMNAGENFQRAMDIVFVSEKDKFVSIYLYDLTIFSNSNAEHLMHLRQTLEKCRNCFCLLTPISHTLLCKKVNF